MNKRNAILAAASKAGNIQPTPRTVSYNALNGSSQTAAMKAAIRTRGIHAIDGGKTTAAAIPNDVRRGTRSSNLCDFCDSRIPRRKINTTIRAGARSATF